MKITKSQAAAVLAVALTVAAAGIGSVYADTEATAKNNPMNGLISAIAAKFNLNTNDVQQVFDEQRTKMEVLRQQNFADRLVSDVAGGKLIQAQADAITTKQAKMQTLRTEMQGKTAEEKRTALKAQMDDLKQWAKDNNIPQEYLMMGGRGFSGRPGPGMRFHGFSLTGATGTSNQ